MGSTRGITPGLVTVLGFLVAIGPFATDLYLPALPQVGAELGVDASAVQLTLTAFLLGIGAGQLLWGPLSDRFGRRRVMVAAMAVFALSSIAMIFVPNIALLVVLRLVQGVSGSAGIVLSRAVAVDLSPRATAVRTLSMMASMAALGMLIAPIIGGITTQLLGWRGTLAALAAVTTAMFVLALLVVPESLPREERHRGGLGQTLRRFRDFVRDRQMIGWILTYSLSFAGKMAFIAGSSFVVQELLGAGPVAFSLVFLVGAAAFGGTAFVNGRIAPRVGQRRLVALGLALGIGAGAVLLGVVLSGTLSLLSFSLTILFVMIGTGFVETNSSALSLARAHSARGTGAALLGSTQFLFGAAVSPLVGLAGGASAVPMAVIIVVAMVLSAGAAIFARRAA